MEAAIENSCAISQGDPVASSTTPDTSTCIAYKDRTVPVWSVGSYGAGDGQMNSTEGLAIDQENEEIYIADMENNRIVIFTKDGNFQRNLTIDDLTKPFTILIVEEHCFITCDSIKEPLIVKVNKKTGNKLATLKPGLLLKSIVLDKETNLLFGCPWKEASIWFIQQDLKKIAEVRLETTTFTQGTTKIHGIQTRKDEIFILFYKSPFLLQSFSRDGNFIRNIIISTDMNDLANFFVIDSQNNFIISWESTNRIKIFSKTGERIAIIGKDDTDESKPGELYSPRGLALTKDGNIVVCDGKQRNILQMF